MMNFQEALTEFMQKYPSLAPCEASLAEAYHILADCFAQSGKLLICGNGGSAADSEHIVGELMKGFEKKRPLTDEQKAGFAAVADGEALASRLQNTLPAISLVSQTALLSAISNDNGAEMVYAQQVWGYGQRGDVLLALSTSGYSENVLLAAKTAAVKGMSCIAITGEGGSPLAAIASLTIALPAKGAREVQELTMPVYHFLCKCLEDSCFPI